jgi:SAM-dependent methyltransferase
MAIRLAFCNDCDLQSWDNYKIVHREFAERSIAVGDSFWLFDPSGGDFGLFRRDCTEKGPKHEELLEEISAGRLDVLHSAGSYGARFSQGLKPERKLISEALEYLGKNARVPRVWTNHGDDNNTQNIGGAMPQAYHRGDLPGSDSFILDLLLEHGVEYFWLDRHLTMQANQPVRLVASEKARSGHHIKVFSRFMGTAPRAPNGQNLHKQLNDENLEQWIANGQNVIIYQHWTCHHTSKPWAYTPTEPPLTDESLAALSWLREKQAAGKIEVIRLCELLDDESRKMPVVDIDRIARIYSKSQNDAADIHYYTQFHKHTIPYFNSRLNHLNPKGAKALDAGCGVGQWSLCLTERFDEIEGFDSSPGAVAIANNIAASSRLKIDFSVRDIYSTDYPNDHFDFVLCYGVIFLVEAQRALKEIYRVMSPGSSCYFSINGDGWYQYLIEDRFKDRDDKERQIYVDCLWNAYVDRCGGISRVHANGQRLKAKIAAASKGKNREALREILADVALESYRTIVQETAARFSDYVLVSLVERILLEANEFKLGKVRNRNTSATRSLLHRLFRAMRRRLGRISPDGAPTELVEKQRHVPFCNRPYTPEEFENTARSAGFVNFRWGQDASLSFDPEKCVSTVKPLHELYYEKNLRVWECIVTKPENSTPGIAGTLSSHARRREISRFSAFIVSIFVPRR